MFNKIRSANLLKLRDEFIQSKLFTQAFTAWIPIPRIPERDLNARLSIQG